MITILHIDTSSNVCSVGISINNKLIDIIEESNGFSHSEKLHLYISSLLNKNQLKPSDLSAVAVNQGPGSYTGLRIGVSAAKGMAFALNIPLIGINSLHALCYNHSSKNVNYYLPMLDARRMEVYTCLLDKTLKEVLTSQAKIITPESYLDYLNYQPILCLGDGAEKCAPFLNKIPGISFSLSNYASVENFYQMAFEKFLKQEFSDITYFEPNYLKPYYFKT